MRTALRGVWLAAHENERGGASQASHPRRPRHNRRLCLLARRPALTARAHPARGVAIKPPLKHPSGTRRERRSSVPSASARRVLEASGAALHGRSRGRGEPRRSCSARLRAHSRRLRKTAASALLAPERPRRRGRPRAVPPSPLVCPRVGLSARSRVARRLLFRGLRLSSRR